MATNEHIPSEAVTPEAKLRAISDLLQSLASDMGAVANVVHGAIGRLEGADEVLPSQLRAAASLAESSAALADRVSAACGSCPVRGGFEQWVMSDSMLESLRTIEARAAG